MDKWSDDYICDGQLSLFPVDFEKCMNPPETEYQYKKRKLKQKLEAEINKPPSFTTGFQAGIIWQQLRELESEEIRGNT